MHMHTGQKAHANRPPNRLGNPPLIHVPQARFPLRFDPAH